MSMTLIQSIICSLTWLSRAGLKSNLHWVTCHTFVKVGFFSCSCSSGEVPINGRLRKIFKKMWFPKYSGTLTKALICDEEFSVIASFSQSHYGIRLLSPQWTEATDFNLPWHLRWFRENQPGCYQINICLVKQGSDAAQQWSRGFLLKVYIKVFIRLFLGPCPIFFNKIC